MSDEIKITGGCLCGAVRYEANQLPVRSACCHCRMCQKALGAAFLSGVDFLIDAVRYTTGAPKFYKSSDIAERGFCAECGTSIAYQIRPDFVDWTLILTATLDDPNAFPPIAHYGVESQLHWLKLDDGLPRTEYNDDFIECRAAGETDYAKLVKNV